MTRRDHAAVKIHDPLKFETIEPGLADRPLRTLGRLRRERGHIAHQARPRSLTRGMSCAGAPPRSATSSARRFCNWRSEEHTSELQSLMRISYAVFCLIKKKQQNIRRQSHNNEEQSIGRQRDGV